MSECRHWTGIQHDRCKAGTHHNALDDAEHQARHLIEIFRAMRPTNPHQEAS